MGQQLDVTKLKAGLRFADLSKYDQEGHVNFVDVTVNRTTDTVLVRATFPNPNGALVDGQLVHVSIEAGKPVKKVVIPQSASSRISKERTSLLSMRERQRSGE